MELMDLDATEQAALIALLSRSIPADGTASESEQAILKSVVEAFGEEAYCIAAKNAATQAPDAFGLRKLLEQVTNGEAQELIYGTLLDIATDETVDPQEDCLLDLVATIWKIKPQFADYPSEG